MSRPRFVPEGVTPLPWKDGDAYWVMTSEPNMRFIAHAANTYQELAEALDGMVSMYVEDMGGECACMVEGFDALNDDYKDRCWTTTERPAHCVPGEAAALLQRCREFAERGGRA